MKNRLNNQENSDQKRHKYTLNQQSRDIENELIRLIHLIFRQTVGNRFSPQLSHSVSLEFLLSMQSGEIDVEPVQPILEQIRNSIKEVASPGGHYAPGYVFCYLCESSDCVHSLPPSSKHVFAGYQSNGKPEWTVFHQMLLDQGDHRIAILFDDNPEIIGQFTRGRDLKRRMMKGFGKLSKTYDLLGQVTIGYIPLSSEHGGTGTVDTFALTVQAVESRNLEGNFDLNLNLIAGLSDPAHIGDQLYHPRLKKITQALNKAKETFDDIVTAVGKVRLSERNAVKNKRLRAIPKIMGSIIHALEIQSRQQLRRTSHAVDRIAMNRPVPASSEDAQNVLP
ncbi:hypothetical protein JW979_04130, partial [bacterium]|nr:hypothetical protein [candidate division CSSED10-310 bacterium]